MAALVDTNVLVYRFDGRFPAKQRVARELLRRGIAEDSIRIPHQAVSETGAFGVELLRARNLQEAQDSLF